MPLFDNGPVLAENAAVGGDGDASGIAQDITLDDIRAIAFSGEPLETRREELNLIRDALAMRAHGDGGNEFLALLPDVDRMIAEMDPGLAGVAGDGDTGMDPDVRSDAMAPDAVEDFARRKSEEG